MRDLIKKILREELTPSVKRRLNFNDIERIIDNRKIEKFLKNQDIEKSVHNTIHSVMYDVMPTEFEDYGDDYHTAWDEIKEYIVQIDSSKNIESYDRWYFFNQEVEEDGFFDADNISNYASSE